MVLVPSKTQFASLVVGTAQPLVVSGAKCSCSCACGLPGPCSCAQCGGACGTCTCSACHGSCGQCGITADGTPAIQVR